MQRRIYRRTDGRINKKAMNEETGSNNQKTYKRWKRETGNQK